MKYITILGDGWSDIPNKYNSTPLKEANKPTIDQIAQVSTCGLCKTVPDGMKPGSDVANMAVMGFDPAEYYTGRSPLEAASMGIELGANDVSYRCNLVTLSGDGDFEDLAMDDYSAGEIETETAARVIEELNRKLTFPKGVELHAGVSYRHCLVVRDGKTGAILTPPHDITGKPIAQHLPGGNNADFLLDFMKTTRAVLANSDINKELVAQGKKPITCGWLWGEGTRPSFKSFEELHGLKGAVISAVDLVKGIGKVAGMDSIDVEGATGTLTTNFGGKAQAAINALRTHDYVYLHIEAPDECGHQGDYAGKVEAIERIDGVVSKILDALKQKGEKFRMLICPDHPTPVSLRTHTSSAVPFIIYDSEICVKGIKTYNEEECAKTGKLFKSGVDMLKAFLDDTCFA